MDVRRREDVREGPPAAGDLPVGGLVVGDQRLDLLQEPPDLGAGAARGCVGGEVHGDVHVTDFTPLGGGSAEEAGRRPRGRRPSDRAHGYERTQPPLLLLKALLQSDWTGKVVPLID